MQQHPVPQNVTNFQFKLVGDMTLKQFGYLAGGVVLAILASKLPYPVIFNYSLAGIFAFSGFALAFLPIEDRPLDIWLKNFIISIFSPTQFVYKKTGGTLDFLNIDLTRDQQNATVIIEKNLKKDRYRDYISTLPSSQKNLIDEAINNYLSNLNFEDNTQTQKPHKTQNYIQEPGDIRNEVKVRPLTFYIQEEKNKEEQKITENKIEARKKEELNAQYQEIKLTGATTSKTTIIHDTYTAPKREDILKKVDFEYLKSKPPKKEETEDPEKKRQEEIAKRLEEIKQTTPQETKIQTQKSGFHTIDVSKIEKIYQTPQTPKTPNIICGVVLDTNDKPLIGAILEIKNSRFEPERTLRTNKIGQFFTATPLLPGEYIISVEYSGFSFDNIRIVLDNKIIAPLLIRAKKIELTSR